MSQARSTRAAWHEAVGACGPSPLSAQPSRGADSRASEDVLAYVPVSGRPRSAEQGERILAIVAIAKRAEEVGFDVFALGEHQSAWSRSSAAASWSARGCRAAWSSAR